MIPELHLPDGLTPARFLKEYWQKKPLLMRQALPGFADPLSPEELAGLSCEEGVESRLVLEKHGKKPWELRHGSFTAKDFLSLPETHWTLLVQDVEKHLPEFHQLIEPFRFIPDWRIDDLMISYAATQGSVGPHVDDYDVFLLQGMGCRRWRIDSRPTARDNLLPDTELRIMADFHPEQEWVLKPGDILYLPPRLAHHGVALEPCLSYSIGFRAPTCRTLLEGFLSFLMDDIDSDNRYGDPDLELQKNPGEITAAAMAKIRDLLLEQLHTDAETIESWFGRFITEPKPGFEAIGLEEPLGAAQLEAFLKIGRVERNSGSRFAYVDHGDSETALFVDGQEFVLGPQIAFLAPLLCQHRVISGELLHAALAHPDAKTLVLDLINEGYLMLDENE